MLVGVDGRVRVGDFGLARAQGGVDVATSGAQAPVIDGPAMLAATFGRDHRGLLASPLTLAGAVVGTPAYMSPEQLGGGEVDARSDQFSFCAALYEALYDQRAFAGETLPALIESVRSGVMRPPPPGHAAPQWLLPLLARGLAPRPADRFPDMAALLAELGRDIHRDPRQGATERRRLGILISLTIVGVSVTVVHGYLNHGEAIGDPFDLVRTSTLALGTFVAGVAVFGRDLMRNHYHRAVIQLTMIMALQMVVVRLALALAGASILVILQLDFITFAAMFAAGGLLVARWLGWVAVLPALGAAATVVMPDAAPFVAQLVYPGIVVAYLIGWGRGSRRGAAATR